MTKDEVRTRFGVGANFIMPRSVNDQESFRLETAIAMVQACGPTLELSAAFVIERYAKTAVADRFFSVKALFDDNAPPIEKRGKVKNILSRGKYPQGILRRGYASVQVAETLENPLRENFEYKALSIKGTLVRGPAYDPAKPVDEALEVWLQDTVKIGGLKSGVLLTAFNCTFGIYSQHLMSDANNEQIEKTAKDNPNIISGGVHTQKMKFRNILREMTAHF